MGFLQRFLSHLSTLSVTRIIDAFNRWLGSELGFIQATLITFLWVPFVVIRIDNHGFFYLYIATALSLITNFSLAIYARRLAAEQDKFESWLIQMLKTQADTTTLLLTLSNRILEEIDEARETAEAYHQQHPQPE